MARIDPPDSPGFRAVAEALGANEGITRLVGGCVRDALVGVKAKDIDLATQLSPEEVIERLETAKIKVVPTGIAHGTVTAVTGDGPVEITTLRRDVATDGRRATIAYTDDWHEDAERRDFTINALYADAVSGQITDYFGGVADLSAGIVRFIGEPHKRIAEDHLRILRFFRFTARFAKGAPDAASLNACADRANDLMALSRERIAMEMLAILTLADPEPVLKLMTDHGILKPVLPEISSTDNLTRLVMREAEAGIAADAVRRLASLLPRDAGVAEDVGNRLKLSNVQKKRLVSATGEVDAPPQALAYWITPELAIDRLLLSDGDAAGIRNWEPPHFPLTGGTIVARGVSAGPEVARILQSVEKQWVEEGFPDSARIDEILTAHLR
jgi:poly(A) polymerase